MKSHVPEKAPAFTNDDMDKLENKDVFTTNGQIHKDLVRRKLQYELTQSTLRRGGNLHDALRGDIKEDVSIKPRRMCLACSTAHTKTHREAENHIAACECGTDDSYEYHPDVITLSVLLFYGEQETG